MAKKTDPNSLAKINFDLNQFDENGLYGPANGKRAMDYEFCIPKEEDKLAKVKSIDPSLQIHADSKGRIACSKQQYLCIGNTHQPNFKAILIELSNQPFIERIEQTFFE